MVGSPATTVTVIDTGCELTHPDLAANMLPGRDVVDGDDDPSPHPTEQGAEHGTACSGIIAAVGNNGVGISGTCPTCTLRCVRFLTDHATPLSADVEAFSFAIDHGEGEQIGRAHV